MKMYIVEVDVTVEVPVAAESEEEARDVANQNLRDEIGNMDHGSRCAIVVEYGLANHAYVRAMKSLNDVPDEFLGCRCYTADGDDPTPEDIFAAQAEPLPSNADNIEPEDGGLSGS